MKETTRPVPTAARAFLAALMIAGFAVPTTFARDRWIVGVHRRLAETATSDTQPMVNSDGTLVVFTAQACSAGMGDIYVLELATGAVRRLTFDSGNQTPSFCHADGATPCEKVIYSGHYEQGPNGTILAVDTSGNGPELVGPVAGAGNSEGVPNQLPDGRIVYQTQSPQWGIWYMNEDGTGATKLSDVSLRAQEPRVSPDGTRITYHTQSASGTCCDIYVCDVPAPGSTAVSEKRITSESAQQGCPSFSPDGEWIAYQSMEDGGQFFDIWVVKVDDPSVRQQITFEDTDQKRPCWLPDGSGIVYEARERGDALSKLWLVELGSGKPEPPAGG
jgi:Tol biopolymer transport system component